MGNNKFNYKIEYSLNILPSDVIEMEAETLSVALKIAEQELIERILSNVQWTV